MHKRKWRRGKEGMSLDKGPLLIKVFNDFRLGGNDPPTAAHPDLGILLDVSEPVRPPPVGRDDEQELRRPLTGKQDLAR